MEKNEKRNAEALQLIEIVQTVKKMGAEGLEVAETAGACHVKFFVRKPE